MIKRILLGALSFIAVSVSAQTASAAPAIDDMNGDFIVMNSRVYNDVKSLAEMKGFTISKVNEDSIRVSGFYMNNCYDFNAEYDDMSGSIYIPAGTPIYDLGSAILYLYPWNDETEEVIMRPIEYMYNGHDTWICNTTIMLVAINGEDIVPYYFSEGSKIARCNGTTDNISYVGQAGSQDEYVESRASYVVMDGNYIDIYNLLLADQFGYGVHVSGIYSEDNDEVWFNYAVTGTANDGTYRILTGCEYDEETNMPTGMSYPDTQSMGLIKAKINMESGEMVFEPMAIWAATYDSETGQLTVDENLLYEFVKSVNVKFDVEDAIESDIDNIATADKQIERVEFFTIDGMKIDNPENGTFIIKKIYYSDKSTETEKIIF